MCKCGKEEFNKNNLQQSAQSVLKSEKPKNQSHASVQFEFDEHIPVPKTIINRKLPKKSTIMKKIKYPFIFFLLCSH